MKKWTKKQFLEKVKPCGYRWRIWWFFIWHRHVTLLDVLDAKLLRMSDKFYVVLRLDEDLYWEYRSKCEAGLAAMRAELEGVG